MLSAPAAPSPLGPGTAPSPPAPTPALANGSAAAGGQSNAFTAVQNYTPMYGMQQLQQQQQQPALLMQQTPPAPPPPPLSQQQQQQPQQAQPPQSSPNASQQQQLLFHHPFGSRYPGGGLPFPMQAPQLLPQQAKASSLGGLAPLPLPTPSTIGVQSSARLSARCPVCSNIFAYAADLVSSTAPTTADVLCPVCHAAIKLPPAQQTTTTTTQQQQLHSQQQQQQQHIKQTHGGMDSSGLSLQLKQPLQPSPPGLFLFHPPAPSTLLPPPPPSSSPHLHGMLGGSPSSMSLLSPPPGLLSGKELAQHESAYYAYLSEHRGDFDNPNSALVWLARATPSRTYKLAVPKVNRVPKSTAGVGGYCEAFTALGLVLREADTSTGHWHSWYADPRRVSLKALQSALMRRWRESPTFTEDMLLAPPTPSNTQSTNSSSKATATTTPDTDTLGAESEGTPAAAATETTGSASTVPASATSVASASAGALSTGIAAPSLSDAHDLAESSEPSDGGLDGPTAQGVTNAFASLFAAASSPSQRAGGDEPTLVQFPSRAWALKDSTLLACIRAARAYNAALPEARHPRIETALQSDGWEMAPTTAAAPPVGSSSGSSAEGTEQPAVAEVENSPPTDDSVMDSVADIAAAAAAAAGAAADAPSEVPRRTSSKRKPDDLEPSSAGVLVSPPSSYSLVTVSLTSVVPSSCVSTPLPPAAVLSSSSSSASYSSSCLPASTLSSPSVLGSSEDAGESACSSPLLLHPGGGRAAAATTAAADDNLRRQIAHKRMALEHFSPVAGTTVRVPAPAPSWYSPPVRQSPSLESPSSIAPVLPLPHGMTPAAAGESELPAASLATPSSLAATAGADLAQSGLKPLAAARMPSGGPVLSASPPISLPPPPPSLPRDSNSHGHPAAAAAAVTPDASPLLDPSPTHFPSPPLDGSSQGAARR